MVTLDEKIMQSFVEYDTEEEARKYYTVYTAMGLVYSDADTEAFVEELEQHIEDFKEADDEEIPKLATERVVG